jgi:hypothetical protein
MEGMEEIRLEALKALTILAIHDDQFRNGLFDDLEGTLSRYGLVLNDPEMTQVRNFIYAAVDSIDDDILSGLTVAEQHR